MNRAKVLSIERLPADQVKDAKPWVFKCHQCGHSTEPMRTRTWLDDFASDYTCKGCKTEFSRFNGGHWFIVKAGLINHPDAGTW